MGGRAPPASPASRRMCGTVLGSTTNSTSMRGEALLLNDPTFGTRARTYRRDQASQAAAGPGLGRALTAARLAAVHRTRFASPTGVSRSHTQSQWSDTVSPTVTEGAKPTP